MIRHYSSDDALPVATLFTETIRRVSSSYYSPAEIEAWLGEQPPKREVWHDCLSKLLTLIDEREGEIVGFGSLSPCGNVIEMLFTHHAHQREGIGTELLQALEDEVQRRGHSEVVLTASATAWPFYQRRGYDYLRSEKKKYGNIWFDCQELHKALPVFPAMRRNDRQLDDAAIRFILDTGSYGFLATCGTNGYGYGVPVNYVMHGNAIYIHCATEGFKLNNIRRNNRVSFCVVARDEVCPEHFTTFYESALVFGRATLDLSDDERRQALELLSRKYCPQQQPVWASHIDKSFKITQVVRLDIEWMTGKKRPRK